MTITATLNYCLRLTFLPEGEGRWRLHLLWSRWRDRTGKVEIKLSQTILIYLISVYYHYYYY